MARLMVRNMAIINQFTKPIAIMKHGLKHYGGERILWKSSEDITFFHILVRIKEELKRAKEEGMEFYPYALQYKGGLKSIRNLGDYNKPLDIYFVPIKNENNQWPVEAPNKDGIKWNISEDRFTELELATGEKLNLPSPVRVWSKKTKKYPALLIDELECFVKDSKLELDFDSQEIRHTSSNKLIEKSMSGRLTFGVFQPKMTGKAMKDFKMEVAAKAKLVPPYYGYARP